MLYQQLQIALWYDRQTYNMYDYSETKYIIYHHVSLLENNYVKLTNRKKKKKK